MAVFTPVSYKDLERHLTSYDIGELQSYEGIEEGVENTNYLLHTDKGKFILTLFETRTRASSLPFCFHFMKHLNQANISCPVVLKDMQGYQTRMLCSRPASIISFVEGRSLKPKAINEKHCEDLGQFLAKMHLASSDIEAFRPNPIGFDQWNTLFCKLHSRLDEITPSLSDVMIDQLVDFQENLPNSLPGGVVHCDLFPDNVFFIDDKVSAVIDFYFSCNESFLYDLCLCLNAWCADYKSFEPELGRVNAFLKGYQSVRSLTSLEKRSLPIMRRAAAFRILVTRSHDWLLPPEDQDVLLVAKNPDEYVKKLGWADNFIKDGL